MTPHKRRYIMKDEHYETSRYHFEYVIKERETERILYRTMGYNHGIQILERLNRC